MKWWSKSLTLAVLIALSTQAWSKETINLVWGFNMGSSTAANARALVEEANRIQNKYLFVFSGRPGAGGSIAANAVASSPENTIVSMSSSFIIRPYFEKQDRTHNLNDFVPVLVQGTGAPLFLVSGKHTDLKALMNRKEISIGVSGVGSISHLVALEVFGKHPGVTMVNFKSMPEAVLAAAGQHVDASVAVYGDAVPLLDANRIKILGYTGNKEQPQAKKLLLSKQGVNGTANLVANYAIYASVNMTQTRFKEIRDILVEANKSKSVISSYHASLLTPAELNMTESEVWYALQRRFWRGQVEKITEKNDS